MPSVWIERSSGKDGYTVSNVESINVAYNVRILGIDGVEDDGLQASAIAQPAGLYQKFRM